MITSVASLRQHIVKRCQRAELKNKKEAHLGVSLDLGLAQLSNTPKGLQSVKE